MVFCLLRKGNMPRECAETSAYMKGMALTRGLFGFLQLFLLFHDHVGEHLVDVGLDVGLLAPKGTPPAVVARLNAELAKLTGSAETKRAWGAQGTTPMTMGVDEFGRYLSEDIVKWEKVVKFSGAKPE